MQRWLALKPAEAVPEPEAAFAGAPEEDGDPLRFLEECLAALPPEDRLLLEEKYLKRRSAPDLAADRALSLKALESRLTRARERLRAALTRKIRHADL